MTGDLITRAERVARLAAAGTDRVVLAESCTAGLVAHLLSRIPGASNWFCGSTVVYRNATKTAWLGISAASLDDPAIGPVSAETAAAMTSGVLRLTPEATLAASVTGHLGPNAPEGLDGVLFVGIERRSDGERGTACDVQRHQLSRELPAGSSTDSLRWHRQQEAAAIVLERLEHWLTLATSPP